MISCLLIQVSRDPQGLPVRKESAIAGESIQVGRSGSCKIRLPDSRVHLHHAVIKRSDNGAPYVEGEQDAPINIDGAIERGAELSPGTQIEIGPYLLLVEPAPPGHDLALSVEMVGAQQAMATARRAAPVRLRDLGVSKRRLSIGLAASILFLFLLLPLLSTVSPALDKWQATLPVTLTDSWTPGPISDGHGVFGAKCSTCHQRAFRTVSDETCAGCHKNKKTVRHVSDEDMRAGAFENVRCTSCHLDHRGRSGLILHDSSGCVACHGDLKARKAGTAFEDTHDFAADHPPFRITLRNGNQAIRMRLDNRMKPPEKSGLKFSHKVHLPKGGLETPEGVTMMACRDCHVLEDSGAHFAPMVMTKTCQQSECHKPFFGKPIKENVPHGSEREVTSKLRELYAKWLTASPANRAACRQVPAADSAARPLDCASALVRKETIRLFNEAGEDLVCGQCHEVTPSGDANLPWKITPLHINRDWQPSAVFAHAKHRTAECTECHDKANSRTSADISMPAIGKCRECHAGNRSAKGKIASPCDSCHRFHRGAEENG